MKYLWATLIATCLLFSAGYAKDLPDLMPQLEVTGLVISKRSNIKNAAILNNRVVYEGDLFEIVDGKLDAKVVREKPENKRSKEDKVYRVKVGLVTLLVQKITDKGVTVKYVAHERGMDLLVEEVKVISLKTRAEVY